MARTPKLNRFVAIDFELANRNPRSVCAMGAVAVVNGETVWEINTRFRPSPERVTYQAIHGLSESELRGCPAFNTAWPELAQPLGEFPVWVAHNAAFERQVLRAACEFWALKRPKTHWLCTMSLARRTIGVSALNSVCRELAIPLEHHSPLPDARAAAKIATTLSGS
ncbi:MAG: exonuclease domain-containing protein [Myxococcota bacterium]